MKFVVKKEDLYNGIKIVERATSVKALQPVLMNILIETIDKGTIKLQLLQKLMLKWKKWVKLHFLLKN